MIYIRTKDGIYENKPLEKHLGNRRGKGYEITFRQEEIIKQADTIEGLIMVGDVLTYSSCILDKVWKTRRGKLRVSKYTVDNLVLLKRINSFYIEDKNGNYIKVAKKGKSGGLELI